jgi:hypothetical protein
MRSATLTRVALAFVLLIASSGFAVAQTLSIVTQGPLFAGTVGLGYAQTFQASGGAPPYKWSIASGDTGGLGLDPNLGALQGTPKAAGTYTFTIDVQDSQGAHTTKQFSVVVAAPSLIIVTTAAAANGTTSAPFAQAFAATGGTPPYTWSMSAGSIPGLALDPKTGILAGTPTTPGTYPVSIQARDAAGLTATRAFSLTVSIGPLVFATSTQLPDTALNTAVSVPIQALGGIPPYTWAATGLPAGLTLDASTGVLSGTITVGGNQSFTVRVTDSANNSISDLFRMTVALPPLPNLNFSGVPPVAPPATQLPLNVSIDAAYSVPITGQAVLNFVPDAGAGDSTIQFASGGTTANFTIPTGSTSAVSDVPLAFQTGTVAGTITVTLNMEAAGVGITPSPSLTTHIDGAAPVITSARLVSSSGGFSVEILGYATTREVAQGVFKFHAASGQSLQNSEITIPLDTLFQKWFADSGAQYGSQFFFSQPFNVQGDVKGIVPDTVTLTNRIGSVTAPITQ